MGVEGGYLWSHILSRGWILTPYIHESGILRGTVDKQAVRILLECVLVVTYQNKISTAKNRSFHHTPFKVRKLSLIWFLIPNIFTIFECHLLFMAKISFFKIRKFGLISDWLIWHAIFLRTNDFEHQSTNWRGFTVNLNRLKTYYCVTWLITCCLSVFMKVSAAWVLPGRPSQVSFLRSHPAFTKNCPELTWLCQVNQHSGELCCGLLNKRKQTALINVSRLIREECFWPLSVSHGFSSPVLQQKTCW